MMRRLATAAAGAAVGWYLVQSEVRRRLEVRAQNRRVEKHLLEGLAEHAWMTRGLTVVRARMLPGEEPLSVTVSTTGADGKRRAYVARRDGGKVRVSIRGDQW
jgi:hypothetical protein